MPDDTSDPREPWETRMPTDQLRIRDDVLPAAGQGPCRQVSDSTLYAVAQAALARVARTIPLRAAPAPDLAEIEALCTALRGRGIEAARDVIDGLLAHGHDKTDILRGHLPAVARLMGERWERDEVSFIEVGQAVGRLQRLVHHLRDGTVPPYASAARRALFATLPGETHTLGVVIAADGFRQNGWEIGLSLGEAQSSLLDQLAEQRYAVLGMSIGSARTAKALAALIPEIRAVAPDTRILVSGAYVVSEPKQAARIAGDVWVNDIAGALRETARLTQAPNA